MVITYQLSKELVRMGHKVTVYTSDVFANRQRTRGSTAKGYEKILIDGIDVFEFKSLGKVFSSIYKSNLHVSPFAIDVIRREVKKFGIIHLNEYRTFQNVIVANYARKNDVPYVIQAHGSLPTFTGGKEKIKKLYDVLWGHNLLKGACKVIAVAPIEAEQYKIMGVNQNRIEIVPNAIDFSEFKDLPEKGQFRMKYGLDDKKIVLFLGRIHKIKGLGLLAEAFAKLSKELNNARLVIAGPDYGYLSELRKIVKELKIEEMILFVGPLYGKDKLEAYVDADVYVLPSVYETFPVTVLEACACGTPVIATDRCGIADLIDGQAGYAVPVDKDRLKEAFTSMLSDEKIRQKFGEQGRLLVHEQFTWSKVARQMESIYLSCLQDTRS